MLNIRHTLSLILASWLLSACASAQSIATLSSPIQTSTKEFVVQPTSADYIEPAKATETQTQAAMPSPAPSLLDNLPSGAYIATSGNEGSGFNSIPSIHMFSLTGQDVGILAKNVANTATISPNAKEIAYINFTQPGVSNLAVLNLQTNQARYFSISGCSMPDSTVGWSPDGLQVAVSCGHYISVIDVAGNETKVVLALKIANGDSYQLINQISWSPDGNYLSFYMANLNDARDSSPHGPYLISPKCPNGMTECQLSPYLFVINDLSITKWTPKNLLAVVRNNRIYLFDPSMKKLARSISIPVDTPVLTFAWSPDGQSIAYSVSSQDPNVLAEETYIMATSGGNPVFLSKNNGDGVMFWIQIPSRP